MVGRCPKQNDGTCPKKTKERENAQNKLTVGGCPKQIEENGVPGA